MMMRVVDCRTVNLNKHILSHLTLEPTQHLYSTEVLNETTIYNLILNGNYKQTNA